MEIGEAKEVKSNHICVCGISLLNCDRKEVVEEKEKIIGHIYRCPRCFRCYFHLGKRLNINAEIVK